MDWVAERGGENKRGSIGRKSVESEGEDGARPSHCRRVVSATGLTAVL